MVTDNDILNFLIKLEELEIIFQEKCDECTCFNFEYEHIGNIINIVYSWSDPEECANDKYVINLLDKKYTFFEDASTVYGDYKNENVYCFENLNDILENFI